MVTDEKQVVIDAVIEQLKKDFDSGDYTVLYELLGFVPTKRLVQSLPEEKWSEFTPPKFVPYIEERCIVHPNGITEYIRKRFRARTAFDWAPPKISFGNYAVEWTSIFDNFNKNYWKGDGYYADVITKIDPLPLENHYGNSSLLFLFNLLRHFPTKDLLLGNIDKWSNYYRKHVTDTLSNYSSNVLRADILLQRSGLSDGLVQKYQNHTLEEIENSDVKEYYKFSYQIFEDHIDFCTNSVYPNLVTVKVYFK